MRKLLTLWIALAAVVGIGGPALAQLSGGLMFPGPGTPKAAGGGATATFNPAFKNAGITLSNGNLTATTSTGGFQLVGSTVSKSSGLFYCEMTLTYNGANRVFGLSNNSESLSNFAGASVNSIGWIISDGRIFLNNAVLTTIASLGAASANVASMAVDFTHSKIWFRVDAGNWNNDILANQNPATNTGGISIAGLAGASLYFPAANPGTSDNFTANFGATAYAQSVPSGFGNWQ
jgi:hypothetical protein